MWKDGNTISSKFPTAVAKKDREIKYDEKTFTNRGCKYCPSNMLGQGRTFVQFCSH